MTSGGGISARTGPELNTRNARRTTTSVADKSRFHAPRFVDDLDEIKRLDRLVAVGVTDVRVHLDRVNTYIELNDPERVYGALLDLFIATGPPAAEVRRRALFWSREILSPRNHAALAVHITQGLRADEPLPLSSTSVLSKGVTGQTTVMSDSAVLPRATRSQTTSDSAATTHTASPTVSVPRPRRGGLADRLSQDRAAANPGVGSTLEPSHADGSVGLIRAVREAVTHADSSRTTVRLHGSFGTIDIRPGAITMVLAPGADLVRVRSEQITSRTLDPTEIDDRGAVSTQTGLWNLGVAVFTNTMPADLDLSRTYRLAAWPDLTRITRVVGDLRVVGILSKTPTRLDTLLDVEPESSRVVISAAWVAGLLVPSDPTPSDTDRSAVAPRTADTGASGPKQHTASLRGFIARLRRASR